ncbi:MAG: SGNH/GDSL hydrolase family protein [Planctomycetes bacterium]|nr:SGNH/GDSL hydrolase family protein [Planctomycetota bacterium]
MKTSSESAASIVFLLALCNSASASQFSQMVVFGDSLSDAGNIFTLSSLVYPYTGELIPGPPYVAGRFSNGAVWTDYLGAALGLNASRPSLLGGTNYAFGGANTDVHNYAVEQYLGPLAPLGQLGVTTQIGMYARNNPAPPSDRLYVLWAGANDFFNDLTTAYQSALNMVTNVAVLYDQSNARHFLVSNLPPLGLTPRYLSTPDPGDDQQKNLISAAYGYYLKALLDSLRSQRPDVQVYYVDIFSAYFLLAANPAAFGFDNITNPAYDEATGTIVPDPSRYLYWDEIHPTTNAHRLIAAAAFAALPAPEVAGRTDLQSLASRLAAIPEPATLWLLGWAALLVRPRARPRRRGKNRPDAHI